MAILPYADQVASFIAPARDWVEKNAPVLDFSKMPDYVPYWIPGLNIIWSGLAGVMVGSGAHKGITAGGVTLAAFSVLTTSNKSNKSELAEEVSAFAIGLSFGLTYNAACSLSGRGKALPSAAAAANSAAAKPEPAVSGAGTGKKKD